jgi:hypothetical protein
VNSELPTRSKSFRGTPNFPIRLKQHQWHIEEVLPLDHQIPRQHLMNAPTGVVENFGLLLSRDVYSEGDSQILYDHLLSRRDELNHDFLVMLDLWLEDELKHYEALRRTYRCLSGVSYGQMDRSFQQRIHNLEPIQMLLQDEFTILVTLMFDEIGSVYSYRRDLAEYYRYFGTEIQQVAYHLVKDEGAHFGNAAELLLWHHPHRLREVPALLTEIVALERRLGKYYQVFFLDHAQEQHRFPPHFNQLISQVVLARLDLGRSPNPSALRQLWQWKPTGQNFTPLNQLPVSRVGVKAN